MPTIYEQRTYSVTVGQMAEVQRLYATQGWPALVAGGFAKNCIGYFVSDTGELQDAIEPAPAGRAVGDAPVIAAVVDAHLWGRMGRAFFSPRSSSSPRPART